MSPLGKRIIVFFMLWVVLAMVVIQAYDNVLGKGMPVRVANATPTPTAVTADQGVQHLADLQSCVASNPNNLQCNTDLAELYYQAGQYDLAQVNYERAVKLDPHNVKLLLKLAGTYIFQQMFDKAVATLQQAATEQPDSPEIHLLLGLSLSKLDPPRTDQAVTEWRKVISLAPGSDWANQAATYINQAGK